MNQPNRNEELAIRKVATGDINILFDWANDDLVRRNSLSSDKIPFEQHEQWFAKRINSTQAAFYILELNNLPAALVKFEFDSEENAWLIGYSVAREFRGMGLGKEVLIRGIEVFAQYPLTAYVKPENLASIKIFEALGFENRGTLQVKGNIVLKFTLQ